jgi:zinc transport system substrate-binding protein
MRLRIILMRRAVLLCCTALLAGAALAGCAGHRPDDGLPRVVTTLYPLQFVAQRIVGSHAHVQDLTRPGVEPHDLELNVRATAAVSDADVVVYERGFQASVDQGVEQNGPPHVVDVSTVVDLVPASSDGAGGEGVDPHFWMDPARMVRVAAAVRDEMVEVDPAHRAAYRRNFVHLRDDLESLDHAYRTGLADCAIHTIVVSHDAFGYLGKYGLQVVSINGLSPEAEPSPAHIKALHDLIAAKGITTVFSETLASPEMADTLAHDLGIRAAVLDPIEGLTTATRNQDYLSLMRHNLAAIKEANQCR